MIVERDANGGITIECPICGDIYYCHECQNRPTDECSNCIIEGKASKEANDWF